MISVIFYNSNNILRKGHSMHFTEFNSKRFRSIDCIKGICIIFVIITHYNFSHEEKLALFFPFWIDMAVPVFMIVSGFVYSKSYIKANTLSSYYNLYNIISKVLRFTIPFTVALHLKRLCLLQLVIIVLNYLHYFTHLLREEQALEAIIIQ